MNNVGGRGVHASLIIVIAAAADAVVIALAE